VRVCLAGANTCGGAAGLGREGGGDVAALEEGVAGRADGCLSCFAPALCERRSPRRPWSSAAA
jgi:hypothetical protein